MTQGALLILVIVMGGGIAYIADIVGKHLGKKRLSLFGLRPRHTAAVGTVLLGVIITLFTFGTIFALSSGVRLWLIRGPALVREVQDQIESKQDQAKEADKQNRRLRNSNKDLTDKYSKLSDQVSKGRRDLADEQAKYGKLQGQTGLLQQNIKGLTGRVNQENDQINRLGSLELASERKLKRVQGEEKQAEQIRTTAINQKNEVLTENANLVNRNDDLMRQQSNLQAEIKGLQAQRSAAQKELTDSQNEVTEAKRQLGDVEAQLGTIELKLSDTMAKLQVAENTEKFFGQVSKVALTAPLIYGNGEEIARRPIRAGLSVNAAKNEITTLIRTARIDASRKGAIDADIYVHFDNGGNGISAKEIEQQLATQIAGANGNQFLIACSSLNAFKGERVSLEIFVMPNPLVFSAGQSIAETPIDVNKGRKVMVDEITAFLRDKVRKKAVDEGLVPPRNSDVSIGEVTLDDMIMLVDRIRGSSYRQVRLEAVAQSTTRAADSLRLEFRIR